MESLTKQQIVLVTLLVSFVTSIATGIVTVALMDQAPKGVTNTINRIVERTVERVADGNQSASANNAGNATGNSGNANSSGSSRDAVADITDLSARSVVKIKHILNNGNPSKVTGLGVVVSKDGVIVTDKSTIALLGNYVAVMYNGEEIPVQLFQSQNEGDIAFLSAMPVDKNKTSVRDLFRPVNIKNDFPRIGQSVFSLSFSDTTIFSQGYIESVSVASSSTKASISTNISREKTSIGGPLFDLSGNFWGIHTASLDDGSTASFYPLSVIRSAIPSQN